MSAAGELFLGFQLYFLKITITICGEFSVTYIHIYTVFHALGTFFRRSIHLLSTTILLQLKQLFNLLESKNSLESRQPIAWSIPPPFVHLLDNFFNFLQSQSLRFTQLSLTIRETLEHQSCLCYQADKHQVYQSPKLMYMPNFVKYKLSHGSQDYQVQSFLFSQIKEGGTKLSICFSVCSILRRDKRACQ